MTSGLGAACQPARNSCSIALTHCNTLSQHRGGILFYACLLWILSHISLSILSPDKLH